MRPVRAKSSTKRRSQYTGQIEKVVGVRPELRRKKDPLEAEEQQVVDLIFEFTMLNGVPPTNSEMSEILDLSYYKVSMLVGAAIEKGHVYRKPNKCRWTTLT